MANESRYWLCVKCYDVPYKFVMDRRDGECPRHGEVTEVELPAMPPMRWLRTAAEAELLQLGSEEEEDVSK